MNIAYRLSSRRYAPSSGEGARLWGGRWNSVGWGAVYAASSPSLAALEVLVHYSVLPQDYIFTQINIPDDIAFEFVSNEKLPVDWDAELPDAITAIIPGEQTATARLLGSQMFGVHWISQRRSAVLSVPSSVMGTAYPSERNFVLNPDHPDFHRIDFLQSRPFRFDPRLK